MQSFIDKNPVRTREPEHIDLAHQLTHCARKPVCIGWLGTANAVVAILPVIVAATITVAALNGKRNATNEQRPISVNGHPLNQLSRWKPKWELHAQLHAPKLASATAVLVPLAEDFAPAKT